MRKVLLTGASGFVGRQILRALGRFDIQVIPVVRPEKAYILNKQDNIDHVIYSPDIFKESLTWWAEKCMGVHTLIHCAW
jgi:nucleoside-diphosphate-sugar epimerase